MYSKTIAIAQTRMTRMFGASANAVRKYSHKGIINIENWCRPDVLIGGFHFSKLPADDTLAGYARKLDFYETAYYTCHCTGEPQYAFMKKNMRNLHYISTGEILEI